MRIVRKSSHIHVRTFNASMCIIQFVEERTPGYGDDVFDQAGQAQLACHQGNTTESEHLRRGIAAAWFQVGDHRRARGRRFEFLEVENDARLMRDREQVQHRVRRPRSGRNRACRVSQRVRRQDVAWSRSTIAQALHHKFAAAACRVVRADRLEHVLHGHRLAAALA